MLNQLLAVNEGSFCPPILPTLAVFNLCVCVPISLVSGDITLVFRFTFPCRLMTDAKHFVIL